MKKLSEKVKKKYLNIKTELFYLIINFLILLGPYKSTDLLKF